MKKELSFRAQRGTSRFTPGIACEVLRCAQDHFAIGLLSLFAKLAG
jgi:hypothetical protein